MDTPGPWLKIAARPGRRSTSTLTRRDTGTILEQAGEPPGINQAWVAITRVAGLHAGGRG